LMPRVYADGHIAGTDTPGLLVWAATALAFWKGVHEPDARLWRIATGVLLGLAFLTKASTVIVLVPILLWLSMSRLGPWSWHRLTRADLVDGIVTTSAILVPLGLAWAEIHRLAGILPPPKDANPLATQPASFLPGVILLLPLAVWMIRRLLGSILRTSPVWGVERPALESWTALLAFAPAIGWLGNPAWWREALPRLAHYYALSAGRRGALPEIQVLYFGEMYYYNLPWHNGWVLLGITVPAGILAASVAGCAYTLSVVKRDRLPLYFLVHFVTLPSVRMFETPAHDGVRLFLPTFFFMAGLASWGTVRLADAVSTVGRARTGVRFAFAALLLGSAFLQLVRIHPYELSYYNELIGGPRGAWRRGCELSYWYDAFTPSTLARLNRELPPRARVRCADGQASPLFYFEMLQSLGALRGDLRLDASSAGEFPYVWLVTNDSKTSAYTRLLFALRPWFEVRPGQLDGLRVLTIADPDAATRAWALSLLLDRPADAPRVPSAPAPLPHWLRRVAPWLGRFWGEGLTLVPPLGINRPLLSWAASDPDGLRAAARIIAARPSQRSQDARARRLMAELTARDGPEGFSSRVLLQARPEAVIEAVEIIIARSDSLRAVMLRYPFTDPRLIGGYLDENLHLH
jgi:hypothetical protein